MQLSYSPTSPYVRKVSVLLIESGLDGTVERVPTNVWDPSSDIIRLNPIGKVPALITDDGAVLIDSLLICEYLDSLPHAGARLFPQDAPARWAALNVHAIADAAIDAGVSRFLEMRRPEGERSRAWMERQNGKVQRALDWLNGACAAWSGPLTIGDIATGCLLGWLDYRLGGEDWRSDRPALAGWYDELAARPSMRATEPREP